MRIVSWNCGGGLWTKIDSIDRLRADLYIIQECGNPQITRNSAYRNWAGELGRDYLWVGDSPHKGIGVFSKYAEIRPLSWNREFKLSFPVGGGDACSWKTADLKLFLPFQFGNYTILAVWTKNIPNGSFAYIGQLWKYLQLHGADLGRKNCLISGDFNSNAIWDAKEGRADSWWDYSSVVNILENLGLRSLYHHQYREEQGWETQPTFYLQRNIGRPYHIDYAFCSENFIGHCQLEIEKAETWLALSDHMPLILDIGEPNPPERA